MAFTKITNTQLNSRGATTLPNQPKITATALKQEFDAPAKEIVAPAFNGLIDELEAEMAAASLGIDPPRGTSTNVQGVIDKISLDLAYLEGSVLDPVIEKAHTHDNKELLDTYEQTEIDLADAVTKKHSHSNKSVLDKFDETSGTPTYNGGTLGNMSSSDYDSTNAVKTAGGIPAYVTSRIPKVLDSTTYTDVSGTRTFSFSDAAITTTSRIDYYANVFGVAPQSVTLSSGSLTVDFYTADGVTECAVEIK